MAVLITPKLPSGFYQFSTTLERQLAQIEKAAHAVLSTPRHNWPQGWDWTFARRVAKQSLNRIVSLRVACESGADVGQIAYEAFELGRHYELWKKAVKY